MVDDPTLSAQVVLRPASGAAPPGEQLTAATLEGYEPAPQAVATVRVFFERAGFETGEVAGISFAITARRSRFEDVFGDQLALSPAGRAGTDVTVAGGGRELSLEALPDDVAAAVQAVTFTPPPAFGPTDW